MKVNGERRAGKGMEGREEGMARRGEKGRRRERR